jgi:RecB family endonuclease NucS
MPLFTVSKSTLQPVAQSKFASEKILQQLVEGNLEVVFNCRLVASEFPTGAQHAGRIDTLALSEGHNRVIIEYKNIESSDLINQSLFYLSWIHDHRGDFEIAAGVLVKKLPLSGSYFDRSPGRSPHGEPPECWS